MEPPSNYVLRGGLQGAERLRVLSAAKWPSTEQLLLRVGVREGLRCLDVGCGSGDVTVQLARMAGASGFVRGIDQDLAVLECARTHAEEAGVTAEFLQCGAEHLAATHDFDVVYSRFLLTHSLDPLRVVRGMAAAARPGGVVVAEDIEFSGHFCYPESPAFRRYVELYQSVVRQKGADPEIGPKLPGLFAEAGLHNVEFDIVQPAHRTGVGKLMAWLTFAHIREAVVAHGLISENEFNDILSELRRITDSPASILSFPRIFQVWGQAATQRI